MINAITCSSLAAALKRDKNLSKRRFQDILNAALSAYYLTIEGEIAPRFVNRAVQLYYLFRPDCVTEEGRAAGLVECDWCAEQMGKMVGHFLFEWWIPCHPEWEWQEFTEAEARAALEGIGAEMERERLERETYQIGMF